MELNRAMIMEIILTTFLSTVMELFMRKMKKNLHSLSQDMDKPITKKNLEISANQKQELGTLRN